VAPGVDWGGDWETTTVFAYNPYGDYSSTSKTGDALRFRLKNIWGAATHFVAFIESLFGKRSVCVRRLSGAD